MTSVGLKPAGREISFFVWVKLCEEWLGNPEYNRVLAEKRAASTEESAKREMAKRNNFRRLVFLLRSNAECSDERETAATAMQRVCS
jgi:hypothetical protein